MCASVTPNRVTYKPVDYVLVSTTKLCRNKDCLGYLLRNLLVNELKRHDISYDEFVSHKKTYLLLTGSEKFLEKLAESVQLALPLKDLQIPKEQLKFKNWFKRNCSLVSKPQETEVNNDIEVSVQFFNQSKAKVPDKQINLKSRENPKPVYFIDKEHSISSSYISERREMYAPYVSYADQESLFNTSQRSFLVHLFLTNKINLRKSSELQDETVIQKFPEILNHGHIGLDVLKNKYSVFVDDFCLHEPTETQTEKSVLDTCWEQCCCLGCQNARQDKFPVPDYVRTSNTNNQEPWVRSVSYEIDSISRMLAWTRFCCGYLPLEEIRKYFGERIGFYYAWFAHTLYHTLFLAVIGIVFFIYGIYSGLDIGLNGKTDNITGISRTAFLKTNSSFITKSMTLFSDIFDNKSSLIYAGVVCLWGTIYTEYWKRQEAHLSLKWDVNNASLAEHAEARMAGNSGNPSAPNPQQRKLLRIIVSIAMVFTLVAIIAGATFGIQILRLLLEARYCVPKDSNALTCSMMKTVVPVIINVVVISFILDPLSCVIAKFLTDCENHEFQADYIYSYSLKIFLFQFSSNYSSLFYTAFLRKNLITVEDHTDSCTFEDSGQGNCFAMLTIYVAIFITLKPLLKSVTDYILPKIMGILCIQMCVTKCILCVKLFAFLGFSTVHVTRNQRRNCCRRRQNRVDDLHAETPSECDVQDMDPAAKIENGDNDVEFEEPEMTSKQQYVLSEGHKPRLDDFFLIDEYVDKVIHYGYLMIFACTFTLGPLIIFLVMKIDLWLDAKRLLFVYRRPMGYLDQDIGVWKDILEFVNLVGILTSGCIICFVSHGLLAWSVMFVDIDKRILAFIIFENTMIGLKFLLQAMVSDVPYVVRRSTQWEYRHLTKMLVHGQVTPDNIKSLSKLQKNNQGYRQMCWVTTDSDSTEETVAA